VPGEAVVTEPGMAVGAGPTRAPPTTPVPPAGVPWELLGAVVLETPPAGAFVAPCASAVSAPRATTMDDASTTDATRREKEVIRFSKRANAG